METNITEMTRACCANVKAILEEAGGKMEGVARCGVGSFLVCELYCGADNFRCIWQI